MCYTIDYYKSQNTLYTAGIQKKLLDRFRERYKIISLTQKELLDLPLKTQKTFTERERERETISKTFL